MADFIRENDSISVLFIGGNHWGHWLFFFIIILIFFIYAGSCPFSSNHSRVPGPVGSTVIAESLKSNKTLLHLGMDGTETCDEGATAFAAALCENSTLTALNLNSNGTHSCALSLSLW